ncbi:MAG: hypothetical protein Q9163_004047 [Psora crenata]
MDEKDSTRRSQDNSRSRSENCSNVPVARQSEARRKRWQIHLRPDNEDNEQQEWWWASTAIPLLAATIGPLANVMSIAALVTPWRNKYDLANPGVDSDSIGFPDPKWFLGLNGASLACGVVGNIFLLFNFTRRVRYIVALPMTIILWYLATGIDELKPKLEPSHMNRYDFVSEISSTTLAFICRKGLTRNQLIAITISMNKYVPPRRPEQTYSQGFWHAVIAAVLYLVSSMVLMLNMLGYFLGHYPQHFELSDEQRNLILQTMMFSIWLAGGAGIFSKVEGWSFPDAVRVGGIIILGLMVSSIRKFARQLGSTHVVRGHVQKRRTQTFNRSAATDEQFQQMKSQHFSRKHRRLYPEISGPSGKRKQNVSFDLEKGPGAQAPYNQHQRRIKRLKAGMTKLRAVASREPKILLLKEEKLRFDAMRAIQRSTSRFKRYTALTTSVIAFGLLWCVGAIGFWKAEQKTQHLTYFQSLYFCYVSLLTIGYGDLSPNSNAGKPFFIVWSLIAVPTMTILISDMGDTVIASFKRGTFTLADWTVLPRAGVWRDFCEAHPWLLRWIEKHQQNEEERKMSKRVAEGFRAGPPDEDIDAPIPTLEDVCLLDNLDGVALARRLAAAIRRISNHLGADPPKRYTYEEWAKYTRLIRFSRMSPGELEEEEEEVGLVEWDWIGEDSPMLADKSESEWILDRLCESLDRFLSKQKPDTGAQPGKQEEKKDR